MSKKIKNYLFNKKLIIIFFCFSILFSLFFPLQKAEAFVVSEIMAPLKTALEGLEEKVGPIALVFIIIFFLYAFNLIFLFISSGLLQYALDSTQWLVIQNSALVQAGWHFVVGLANLFLILIFVVIAVAYILKIETFQAKKTLVRLIIVALLLNFSLVFIGALVDVANILYNTILAAGGPGFITNITTQLTGGALILVISLAAWIVALLIMFSIPVTAPFAQLGFGIFMVTLNLPTVITWIFQIIIFVMMSGILLTYAFIFAARVFAIQLLAVLAPLAFLCLILPQTRKYWSEWLEHILGWIFVGIMLLFFLVIGSKVTAQFPPPGALTQALLFVPFVGYAALLPVFTYYFFVFVYLVLVLFISQRTMPALVKFTIEQAKAAGGIATRVATPIAGALRKQARIAAIAQKEKKEALEKMRKAEEARLGRRVELKEIVPSWKKRAGLRLRGWATAPERFILGLRGTTPEIEARKEILKKTAKFREQAKVDREGIIARLPKLTPMNKIAAALALKEEKGDKNLSKISDDQFATVLKSADTYMPKKLDDLLTEAQRERAKKYAKEKKDKALAEILDRWTEPEDIIGYLRESPEDMKLWEKEPEKREEIKERVRQRKAFANMKTEDFENMTAEMAAEEEFLKGAAKYCKSRGAIRIMIEKGILEWDKLVKTVRKLGIEKVARTNSIVLAFPYTPGGRALGLTIHPELPKEDKTANREIKEIVMKARKEFPSFEEVRKIVKPPPIEKPEESRMAYRVGEKREEKKY